MRGPWVRSFGILLATVLATVGLSGGVAQAAGITSWDDIITAVEGLGDGESTELSIASEITVEDGAQPLVVPAGKQVTFTGSGKISGKRSPLFSVEEGGTLTLSGPTFTNAQFSVAGDMNLVGGAIRDTAVTGPVIFVNGGTFTISGDAEFSGNNVSDESGKLLPAGVEKEKYSPITAYNGTVRVEGGTVSGNNGLRYGGAIGLWARDDGHPTFEMTGGTLTGNVVSHPRSYGYGGAVYGEGTSANIAGGTVKENTTELGAGLAFVNSDVSLSGGVVVQGNNNGEYKGEGGGLYQSGGTLDISGATFTENVSTGFGGAISADDTKVEISGADITSNTAAKSGGGISFGGTTKAEIHAAILSDNTSQGFWGGGAMYNDTKAEVTIYNGLIRGNKIKDVFVIGAGNHPASAQGGGVWNCPTGSTVMHVTRGVAIFDNEAPNVVKGTLAGAGDDFASIIKHEFDKPVAGHAVEVTERMLGGSPRAWFQDGSIYNIHSNWSAESQVPRYSADGDNTAIKPNETVTNNIAFKSVPTKDAKAIAETLATVKITDNVATGTGMSGGGIANNGTLTFGEPEPWELKLVKKWANDDPKDRPESILVDVKLGDKTLQTVELTKENGWKAELANYPDPSTLIDAKTGEKIPLTFIEHQVDGYMSHGAVIKENEENKTIEVEIVNEPPTSVDVEKRWSGDVEADRPGSVTINLLADGQQTDKSVELTAENGWKGTFKDLPKYVTVNGKKTEIVYTVVEVEVPGYTSSISGGAAEGYVVTNTKEAPPVTSVPVEKRWSGDVEADRPGSVTINLLADGQQTDKSVELTAENGWKGTFTDLPKYVTVDGEKTEIVYTVVEVEVPGYTPSMSGSAAEGYVVTNTKDTPPPLVRTGAAVQGLAVVGVTLLAAGIWAVSKRRRA
ncbi:Cna B-type domain-containing protein [Actinomycetaceae bacterium UMB8039B]|uniref:Cna B-type domain-containing protein n=1 Tax=Pauljensenia sp. UMB8040A TaxID=3046343 RepID=UPI00254B1DA7|nr:Cna B-type domain-containing protein [Pauljensenia sp. UMB8040A]MDK7779990.1 Cna B-type domain-containing protein [Actinomycetaceae bacterium UMB8041B]MDK8293342.1 Cna B-type domain-containing protein [Actinomycetaceae bacterium UMB8039B]MDK8607630.1 Cna B-type domain-containing protein [Actinomycetaceae bacterium UMB8041A]MDK8752976.1 Cna B-type domain-containing protein [Actinomycetaceae bacterium UMB8039A]MDK6829757.1 Cna B-type domain-containing protein [Pauljensenia sp. UMB8040A]